MHVPRSVRFQLGDLEFTWDPAKASSNVEKHGIAFEEAATSWLDPLAIERPDSEHSQHETRWIRIGESLRGALLVVWSSEVASGNRTVIRIIGARRTNKKERKLYEEADEEG